MVMRTLCRRADTRATALRRTRRGASIGAGLVLAAGLLATQPEASAAVAGAAGVPQTIPGELSSVTALSTTDAWAVGLTQSSTVLVEHWDGSSWSHVAAPSPGYVNALSSVSASAANDVWAVGSQFYSGKTQHYDTLVEHYDGASWRVVPSPSLGFSSHLVSVKALAGNDVWAVGWVEESGSGDRTLTEHFDGSTWSVVSSPNPTSRAAAGPAATASTYSVETLNGVWGSGPNDVWAVGSYYPKSNHYFEAPLILHWNGQGWRQIPSPSMPAGAPESYLAAVSGSSAANATAVGAVYTTGWRSLIEHWNGSAWQISPSPNPAGSSDTQLFGTTALGPNETWAVGENLTSGDGVADRLGPGGWRLVSPGNAGGSALTGVSADAPSDAWAVGAVAYGQYVYAVIDHWNGSSWTELTSIP